jgi:hypothetical protein
MDELDLRVRNHVYRRFVEAGRPLRPAETADELAISPDEAEAAYRRLHDGHALVLEKGTTEIRMLNPFSAVPSAYRVTAGGRTWFANCAWDAFGVCAALAVDGHVSAACADCAEPIEIDVRGGEPEPDGYLVHILVPAAHWWDDIVFT